MGARVSDNDITFDILGHVCPSNFYGVLQLQTLENSLANGGSGGRILAGVEVPIDDNVRLWPCSSVIQMYRPEK